MKKKRNDSNHDIINFEKQTKIGKKVTVNPWGGEMLAEEIHQKLVMVMVLYDRISHLEQSLVYQQLQRTANL